MAKVFIEETTLTAIGNAIRSKESSTDLVPVTDMATRITNLPSGGGDSGIPEEAFTISGKCSYRFAYNNWNWFVEMFGDKVHTENIDTGSNMFYQASELVEIPFDININNLSSIDNMFYGMRKLEVCPKIRGNFDPTKTVAMGAVLDYCTYLRDVEDLFTPEMLDALNFKCTSSSSFPKAPKFMECNSLRRVPSWFSKFRIHSDSTAAPSTSFSLYSSLFQYCYALDEVTDLHIFSCNAPMTSNMFSSFCGNANRIKRLTFETDGGQPLVANWKKQTIDLTNYVGWLNSTFNIKANSGITLDKQVSTDETYQALKNDPDWFASKLEYSRYNLQSAIETINSLPDTSAYLATAGGTNTIKFKKNSGLYTDGGGITDDTMVEASAIAAAKGWTVTLS